MDVKDKVKSFRKGKKFTQKKLSELSGLSEITIRKIESGGSNPKIETLQKIAKALEVELSVLTEDSFSWLNPVNQCQEGEALFFKFTEQLTPWEKTNLISALNLSLGNITSETEELRSEYVSRLIRLIDAFGGMSQYRYVATLNDIRSIKLFLRYYDAITEVALEHRDELLKAATEQLNKSNSDE